MSLGSFFGASSKKSKGVVLLDIGSSSVAAGVAVITEGEKPKIIFEIRDQFPIQARLNNKRLLPLVKDSLEKIIPSLSHKSAAKLVDGDGRRIHIKDIACMFSSPWHISTTKTLNFKFEKSFTVSPAFINDIVSYERNNFISSAIKEESKTGFDASKKKDASKEEVLQTFINGYPVLYPIDKKANEFEMILFMSVFPEAVIKSLEKTCGKYFPEADLHFHSSTSVYFHVLRDMFPSEDSFIVAHVSGETTDISVIKKNIITETISFPLGRNFIIRRLTDEVSGLTPSIALSMIRVSADGAATPKLSEKLSKILTEAEDDWVRLFAESLSDFAKNFFLPSKVFVFSGDEASKTFSDLISSKKLKVRGENSPALGAESIDRTLLSTAILASSSNIKDFSLAALAYYFEHKRS